MAGPGGREVGRVSVRVLPDTSRFARELRAFIERVESTLEIELPVTLNAQNVAGDLRRIRQEAERVAATVPVDADTSRFRRDVAADVEAVERSSKASIPLVADVARFRVEVERGVEAADRGLLIAVPLEVQNARAFRARVQRDIARLQAQVRANPVEVPVTYDRRNFERLGVALSDISTPDLSGLSRLQLILAGIAAAAPAAISAIGVALLAIPAAVASVAAPLGVIALGMDGIKEAAKGLKKPLADLKKSLSDVLKAKLTPVFKELARVFPVLRDGMSGVAEEMGAVAGAVTRAVTSAAGLRSLRDIFANLKDATRTLAPVLETVTGTLLILAEVGTRALAPLNAVLLAAAEKFDGLIRSLEESGKLDEAFANFSTLIGGVLDALNGLIEFAVDNSDLLAALGKTLSGLGRAIAFVGDYLGAFFDALSGDTSLGQFAGALGVVNDLGVRLRDWIIAARDALASLSEELQNGTLFETLTGSLRNLNSEGINTSTWMSTMSTSGGEVGRSFADLADSIDQFGKVTLPIVKGIADTVRAQWPLISATAREVWAAVASIVSFQLNWIRVQVRTATLFIQATWAIFGDTLKVLTQSALSIVLGTVRATMQQIRGVLTAATALIRGDWSAAWDAIVSIARAAVERIKTVVRGIADAVKGLAGEMYSAGVAMMSGLAQGIADSAGRAAAAAKRAVLGAISAGKMGAKIQSPSKVTRYEIGQPLGEGIALGIADTAGMIASALTSATALRPSLVPASYSGTGASVGGGITYTGDFYAYDTDELVRQQTTRLTDALMLAGV